MKDILISVPQHMPIPGLIENGPSAVVDAINAVVRDVRTGLQLEAEGLDIFDLSSADRGRIVGTAPADIIDGGIGEALSRLPPEPVQDIFWADVHDIILINRNSSRA